MSASDRSLQGARRTPRAQSGEAHALGPLPRPPHGSQRSFPLSPSAPRAQAGRRVPLSPRTGEACGAHFGRDGRVASFEEPHEANGFIVT